MAVSSFQFWGTVGLLLVLGAGGAHAQRAVVPGSGGGEEKYEPAKTGDELEARYFKMLGILKDPPATGVLVAELGPRSVGEKAGLRPGDILVEYLGVRLDNRTDRNRAEKLRNAVTTAINEASTPGVSPLATMIVVRGNQNVVLTAVRAPLGIRAIAVTAGVGAPQNPVASEHGSFKLVWKASTDWYHVGDAAGPTAAEKHSLALQADSASVNVSTRVLEKVGQPAVEAQSAGIVMGVTDRSVAPAVALQRISYSDETMEVLAKMRGRKIEGDITRKPGSKEHVERPIPPEAVPSLAVPKLAGALPLKDGVVMPLAIVSELDLQTRMGYVLQTRGEATFRSGGEERKGYAVRLWHFGQVEATYFFDDKRALLYAEYEAGIGGVTLRRAESEVDALKALVILRAGALPESATRAPARAVDPSHSPATGPGAR